MFKKKLNRAGPSLWSPITRLCVALFKHAEPRQEHGLGKRQEQLLLIQDDKDATLM